MFQHDFKKVGLGLGLGLGTLGTNQIRLVQIFVLLLQWTNHNGETFPCTILFLLLWRKKVQLGPVTGINCLVNVLAMPANQIHVYVQRICAIVR